MKMQKSFYVDLFNKEVNVRPSFDGLDLFSLSVQQSIMLKKSIGEAEVRQVIWSFGKNKSPWRRWIYYGIFQCCMRHHQS